MSPPRNQPTTTTRESRPATLGVRKMRAMLDHGYGAADDGLLPAQTAGVDPGVRHLTTGLPLPVRLAGGGLLAPRRPAAGSDLAGHVEAIGQHVTVLPLAVTTETQVLPRWPANRTMRLDQPGR